jgi:endonuclease/exonuclease/phosphatase family metal-dependent hydrolase
MRIITWNVRSGNKKILKLITFALAQKPDILCLQEVPYKTLQYLQSLKDYHVSYTYDFQNKFYTDRNAYICTVSKIKPFRSKIIRYFHKFEKSLLNRLIYQILLHKLEQHDAIISTIKIRDTSYSIINARLSCAVGTEKRLEQFQQILDQIPARTIPIICGDLNIVDGRFGNWTTGWFRGFHLTDYKINERRTFELMLSKNNFNNIFFRKNTTVYKPIRLQFDHILIPKNLGVSHMEISKRSYGSDHKMLLVDIDV